MTTRVVLEVQPAQRVQAARLVGAVVASQDFRPAEDLCNVPGCKIDWDSGVVYVLPEIGSDVLSREHLVQVAAQMNMINALPYLEEM